MKPYPIILLKTHWPIELAKTMPRPETITGMIIEPIGERRIFWHTMTAETHYMRKEHAFGMLPDILAELVMEYVDVIHYEEKRRDLTWSIPVASFLEYAHKGKRTYKEVRQVMDVYVNIGHWQQLKPKPEFYPRAWWKHPQTVIDIYPKLEK